VYRGEPWDPKNVAIVQRKNLLKQILIGSLKWGLLFIGDRYLEVAFLSDLTVFKLL
jgi:hypothetical protein